MTCPAVHEKLAKVEGISPVCPPTRIFTATGCVTLLYELTGAMPSQHLGHPLRNPILALHEFGAAFAPQFFHREPDRVSAVGAIGAPLA
jgi:hypothetical protein